MIISKNNLKFEIFNLPTKFNNNKKAITQAIELFTAFFDINKLNVELSFCSLEDIQKINYKFRKINKPTNVLSFPSYYKFNNTIFLGDIIFSIETILKEAKRDNKCVENHLIHLFIHAVLHLLGYDHETEEQAKKMEDLEIEILRNLKIDNPYK